VKEKPLFNTPADISSQVCCSEGEVAGGRPKGVEGEGSEGQKKGVRWAPELESAEGDESREAVRERGASTATGRFGKGKSAPSAANPVVSGVVLCLAVCNPVGYYCFRHFLVKL
jgi:hypothetical protein